MRERAYKMLALSRGRAAGHILGVPTGEQHKTYRVIRRETYLRVLLTFRDRIDTHSLSWSYIQSHS